MMRWYGKTAETGFSVDLVVLYRLIGFSRSQVQNGLLPNQCFDGLHNFVRGQTKFFHVGRSGS